MMSCGMARMAQYVTTGLPGTTASHSKQTYTLIVHTIQPHRGQIQSLETVPRHTISTDVYLAGKPERLPQRMDLSPVRLPFVSASKIFLVVK